VLRAKCKLQPPFVRRYRIRGLAVGKSIQLSFRSSSLWAGQCLNMSQNCLLKDGYESVSSERPCECQNSDLVWRWPESSHCLFTLKFSVGFEKAVSSSEENWSTGIRLVVSYYSYDNIRPRSIGLDILYLHFSHTVLNTTATPNTSLQHSTLYLNSASGCIPSGTSNALVYAAFATKLPHVSFTTLITPRPAYTTSAFGTGHGTDEFLLLSFPA
jgi:hypothetical protein